MKRRFWVAPVGMVAAVSLAGSSLAQHSAEADDAASNAIASKLDPELYRSVQPVCTRCHGASTFLRAREWPGWENTLGRMYAGGAVASPEQWEKIRTYFLRNLTYLYVNNADEDELTKVLGVDEKTAVAIVRRRIDRKFENVTDLEAVPGIDRAVVEALQSRLEFGPPLRGEYH